MAAIGICMYKILRILYGMLKNNKPFNLTIDIANRLRSVRLKNDTPVDNKNRRFQKYDQKAPVSRRQRKKRPERERSQSVCDTHSGITAPVPLTNIIADILHNCRFYRIFKERVKRKAFFLTFTGLTYS